MKYFFMLMLVFMLSSAAFAVQPDEMLKDPVLEARARHISKELRCLVCQGEDIDDSQAPLAADLRKLVRERLTEGDTDEETIAYISDRYGDYVLMSPPLSVKTMLLWSSPFLVIFLGGYAVVRLSQKKEN